MPAIASGVTIAWPSTAATIPSGWTRVTTLDAQYLQAVPDSVTDPGTTGGAATHDHVVASHDHLMTHTHTGTSASVGTADRDSGASLVSGTHTHSVTIAEARSAGTQPATDAASNELSRLEVIWIESDGTPTQIPDGALTFWHEAGAPAGWTVYTDAQGRFLRGAAALGDGGGIPSGSETHSHTAAHTHSQSHDHPSTTSGGPSNTTAMNNTLLEVSAATSNHTHSVNPFSASLGESTSGDAAAQQVTRDPSWLKTGVVESPGSPIFNGTIAVWLGLLANIPSGWFLCDGTNGTPDLLGVHLIRGADDDLAIGTSGGAATHDHPGTSHSHSGSSSSHSHTMTFGSQSATLQIRNQAGTADHALTHSTSHNASTNTTTVGVLQAETPAIAAADNMPPFTQVAFIQFQGNVGEIAGSGGTVYGGQAGFRASNPTQADSDIVVEWDFDNDGDFSEPVEDITSFVLSVETTSGRDWASQLTGKAGPGILKATLNNADDRFSVFNTNSPLNITPNSLKSGRKLRVRTSTAGNPDPALLARDRFNRPNFAVGGLAWTQNPALAWNTTDNDTVAGAVNPDAENFAVTDVGVADYYAQVKIHTAGRSTSNLEGNDTGLIYRWQDTNNYSLAILQVDGSETGTDDHLQLVDVVAGTPTVIFSSVVETYDGMIIGVLVSGTSVTLYQEGVEIGSATAIQTDETEVGIYANWGVGVDSEQPQPELDDFNVWAGLPTEVEGILWTGNVNFVKPDVQAGPRKIASLEGRGVLSRPAGTSIQSPTTVNGRSTGLLVGNVLGRVGLLEPPCAEIAAGDVTTGVVTFDELVALEAMRRFEETEFGFLKESNEGYVCFESRTARDATLPVVTFSDAPGTQFGYHRIDPRDWRREIVNRVETGFKPLTNFLITHSLAVDEDFTASSPLQFTLPGGGTIQDGDLLILAVVAETGAGGQREDYETLSGWRELTGKPTAGQTQQAFDDSRIYVKVGDTNDPGKVLTIATTTEATQTGTGVITFIRVRNWFGELSGIAFGQKMGSSNPPVLLTPWGLEEALFLVFRWGMEGPIGGTTTANMEPSIGYNESFAQTAGSPGDVVNNIQYARKIDIKSLEDPSQIFGTYTGFGSTDSGVMAIRGVDADVGSATKVVVEDEGSQLEHNAIRTHRNSVDIFATQTDAETYGQLVLNRYADDRPIVSISFYASKNQAYRAQAVRRRVSDKITLVAENNSGLGIRQDFFIESINHKWSKGTKVWETTWELSPAA